MSCGDAKRNGAGPRLTRRGPAGLGSRPVSRVLYSLPKKRAVTIHLGRPSPVASCGLPGGALRRTSSPCLLLGLAPNGVCRAAAVTRGAGELLPHRFTLTSSRGPGRFVFCGTFRGSLRLGFSPAPCSVEPGLSSTRSRDENGPRSPGLLPHPLSTERTTRFILRAARSSAPSRGRPSRITSAALPAARNASQPSEVTA
jgi:hypothetical protein